MKTFVASPPNMKSKVLFGQKIFFNPLMAKGKWQITVKDSNGRDIITYSGSKINPVRANHSRRKIEVNPKVFNKLDKHAKYFFIRWAVRIMSSQDYIMADRKALMDCVKKKYPIKSSLKALAMIMESDDDSVMSNAGRMESIMGYIKKKKAVTRKKVK